MSFAARTLLGSGTSVTSAVQSYTAGLNGVGGTTSVITYNANGTVSYTNVGAGDSQAGSNWYPTTASIGSSYYLLVTATSGSFTLNNFSSRTLIGAGGSVQRQAANGASQTVVYTASFSTDAGGVNIVAVITGNSLTSNNV